MLGRGPAPASRIFARIGCMRWTRSLIECQATVLYQQDEVYRLAIAALERAYDTRLLTANSVPWVGNEARALTPAPTRSGRSRLRQALLTH